ncbi:MAG: FtsK/SpoIIIE domain-containing protein [Acidimicrobiia bacterium]
MELALVVQPPGGAARDVAIDIDDEAMAADLVALVAAHLGLADGAAGELAMFDTARKRWLGDQTVRSAALCNGDALLLARREDTHWVVNGGLGGAASAPQVAAPVIELAVVGGTDAGRHWSLPAGTHSVGNDARNEVRLGAVGAVREPFAFEVAPGLVRVVPAPGARVRAEGRRIRAPYELAPGEILAIGEHRLAYRPVDAPPPEREVRHGKVRFNRPPRTSVPPVERTIEAPAVPERSQRPEIAWAMAIAPLLMGVAMVVFTKNILFAGFMFLSPVMVVWQHFDQKRKTKQKGRGDEAEFRRRVEQLSADVASARDDERRRRRITQPDPADVLDRIMSLRSDVWERRATDPDFLALRVGLADLPALGSVKLPDGGRDDLRKLAAQRLMIDRPLRAVPLAPALPEDRSLGLVGDANRVEATGAWCALQAAALHSHRDLGLVVCVPPDRAGAWEWAKWLPHTRDHVGSDGPSVASTPDSSRELVGRLVDLVTARVNETRSGFTVDRSTLGAAVLAVLHERAVESASAVDRLLAEGPEVGVYVCWVGSDARKLPGGIRTVAELPARGFGRMHRPGTDTPEFEFVVDDVPHELVARAARALAPVVDVTSAAGGGGVPRVVNLLEMLDVENPTAEWVARGWRSPHARLDAPIGMAAEGPLTVDLRRDGPHALVAGTTGAGKSELLQTLVASLALSHSPQRLNFLFVDYKGGAAFAECVELPHAVGMVTDLDGRLARRVLLSLNAEVRRREHVFKARGVKDIVEFERVAPEEAPANLIIICDEFAVLAREVPEFVDGIVDVAQRGRSLGMHLVLATQRPAGVVNDNIRANTNLRIALRVADANDSTDVINDAAAVRIPRTLPGRAYARLGHSELTAFQAAYSGGYTAEKDKSSGTVADLTAGAKGRTSQPVVAEGSATDLRRLVDAMLGAAAQLHLPPVRRPWLPPLDPVIPIASLVGAEDFDPVDPGRRAAFGMIDEPAEQRQRVYVHDFESDGNILLYGTSGAGKTTALRSVAASLTVGTQARDVQFFVIDCAAGALTSLADLPHCGGVVTAREAEDVDRMLTYLERQVDERKTLLTGSGAGSFSEFRRIAAANGQATPPRIVVLLDSYGGFSAAFERVDYGAWNDRVQRLVAEGRPLGVSFVITGDRRGAIPYALGGLVECRLVMRMADADELTTLGVPHTIARDSVLPTGRAFMGDGIEMQFAVPGDDAAGDAQNRALRALVEYLQVRDGGQRAQRLESLPTQVPADRLPAPTEPLLLPIGVFAAPEGLALATADLRLGHYLVVGPRQTGRTNALAVIAAQAARGRGAELHLLSGRPSPLAALPIWSGVHVGMDMPTFVESLAGTLMMRPAGAPPVVLVIDDAEEIGDGMTAMALDAALRAPGREHLRIVAACDSGFAARAYSGWLAEVRRGRNVCCFRPDPQQDSELVGTRLRELPGQKWPAGRALLTIDRMPVTGQVAIVPERILRTRR